MSLTEAKTKFVDLLSSIDSDQMTRFLNFIDQSVQQQRGTSHLCPFLFIDALEEYDEGDFEYYESR